MCGKEFLETLGIDRKLFYIIRSISSWATHGERENMLKEGKYFNISVKIELILI